MNWNETKRLLGELTGREFGDTPHNADLREAHLNGAYLSGADLREADLNGANLSGADLRKANLSGADLREANLSGADPNGADLRGAYLSGADLSGADLSGADLQFTSLFSFTAGHHFGFYVPWQRYLKIGCEGHDIEWWLENYEAAGRRYEYTDEETARYGAIIRLIAELYPAE